jgi:hypothetical protein
MKSGGVLSAPNPAIGRAVERQSRRGRSADEGTLSGARAGAPPTQAAIICQGSPSDRRSAAYIARFAEPMPILRVARLKCSECCGAEPGQLARGEIATAIDECGSVSCPLWPFRYGTNPWRAAPSEAQREASREAGRKLAARRNGVDGGPQDGR